MSIFHLVAKRLAPFDIARGHIRPHDHDLGGLGVLVPLTVRRFAPFFKNFLVLGLNTCFGACSWFKHTEVRFGKPVSASLKEENGRRPIFLISWLIEVP